MRINSFWVFAFAISLFSIIISLFITIPPPSSTTTTISFVQIPILIQRIILDDLLSLVTRHHHHHHHHHHHRVKCDKNNWRLRIISHYKWLVYHYRVSLILTVDLKGCANFSSVQKAVDAAPAFSPSKTLIIIDSATYRSYICSIIIILMKLLQYTYE